MKKLDLGNDKISKLLLSFSIPCIIGMIVNSIYNIVDQIFIGQGVGYLGNAATNVIFPVIIICNAFASLIGNGSAANLSLRLGEGNTKEAKRSTGAAIVLLLIVSVIVCILGENLLPTMVNLFGCTKNVYPYAIEYGRIILLGVPFMIVYSGMASFIRADGSPKYSMVCLIIGAVINIILDPLFIFTFDMGVFGGALATVIGQFVSFVIALMYLKRTKSIKLTREDFKLNNSLKRVLGYGLSSFIIQMTILALFVVMNNVMTKYGALSKFGADIPLSVYGVISKLNGMYVSFILGLAIGAQPIIGFNYGAGNYKRVKETIKKVIITGFIIGLIFNLGFVLFTKELVSLFGSSSNALYLEFAIDFCRIFLIISVVNSFEMCSSIIIQSLGNVKKSMSITFIRQIVLFIPLCLILSSKIGIYGALYAGPIADILAFIVVIFIFTSEYKKLKTIKTKVEDTDKEVAIKKKTSPKIIITIAREYGSGGHYIGDILAQKLGIKLYDKALIRLISKESGLSEEFIAKSEETKKDVMPFYNNDDQIFIAESKVIKKLAKAESCIIIGRCADYILKDTKGLYRIFIYNDEEHKLKRATKYYHLDSKTALQEINKINKKRAAHYKYYTNKAWKDFNNYDLCINSDLLGIEKTAEIIEKIILEKK